MAAEKKYKLCIPMQSIEMCKCVGHGFGVRNICCALVGGIMVMGLLFDGEIATQLRVMLLDALSQKYGSINCGVLIKKVRNDCGIIVGDVAELTQLIIEDNKKLISRKK
jgi:hypothetical protein